MKLLKPRLEKFNLETGRLVATHGVATYAMNCPETHNAMLYLFACCHRRGDWGVVCAEDWELNNEAAMGQGENAGRVLSVYDLPIGNPDEGQEKTVRIWMITEWNRELTTILLPSEY